MNSNYHSSVEGYVLANYLENTGRYLVIHLQYGTICNLNRTLRTNLKMNNNIMDDDDNNHHQKSALATKIRLPSWISTGVRKKRKKRATQQSGLQLSPNESTKRLAVESQGERQQSKWQPILEQTRGGGQIATNNGGVWKPLSSNITLPKTEKPNSTTGNTGVRPGARSKMPLCTSTSKSFQDTTPLLRMPSTKQELDPPPLDAQKEIIFVDSLVSSKMALSSLSPKTTLDGSAEDTWLNNDDLFSSSDLEGDSLLLRGELSPERQRTGSLEKTRLAQNIKKPKIHDCPLLSEYTPPKIQAPARFSAGASNPTFGSIRDREASKRKSSLHGEKVRISLTHQQERLSPASHANKEDSCSEQLQSEDKRAPRGCNSHPIDLTDDSPPPSPIAASDSSSVEAIKSIKPESRAIVRATQVRAQSQREEEKVDQVGKRQPKQQQQQQQQQADNDTMATIIAGFKHPDLQQQLDCTAKFRRYLFHTQGELSVSDFDLIHQECLLSRLISFVKKHEKPDLQNEAVWALTCFIGKRHKELEMNTPAIEAIISLLSDTSSDDAFALAVWSLDKIAQISTACRNKILTEGGIHALVASMMYKRNLEALKLLLRLCRGTPTPPLSLAEPAFELLAKIITNAKNTDEVLKEACRSLFYLLNGGDEDRVEIVRNLGMIEGLVAIMLDSTPSTQKWALTVIKLLSRGNILMKQSIMNANPCFNKLLWLSSNTDILSNTCRTIGSIASGNNDLVQLLINGEVFPDLIKFLSHDSLQVRKSAFLAISAATAVANARQIDFLVQKGALRLLCRIWLGSTEKRSILIALQAVLDILRKLEHQRLGAFITVGGKERVQGLADSKTSDTKIRLAAKEVLACVAEIQDTL